MLIQGFERIPLEVNLIPVDSVMALQKGGALCKSLSQQRIYYS